MPHMAPIMWAFIMFLSFLMILILMSMIYFGTSPLTPESKKITKSSFYPNWLW